MMSLSNASTDEELAGIRDQIAQYRGQISGAEIELTVKSKIDGLPLLKLEYLRPYSEQIS